MRYYEVHGQLSMPLSEEESDIVERIKEKGFLMDDVLEERDQLVAEQLSRRGVINRSYEDGVAKYTEYPKARRF